MQTADRNIRPGWLTGRQQISSYTGLHPRTISRLLAQGRIPHKRLGHKLIMVRVTDLDQALGGS
jgi:excisionase family DNA binding protein